MRKLLALLAVVTLSGCGPRSPEPAAAPETPAAAPAAPMGSALLQPGGETAPEKYKVRMATTKGDIVIEVDRSWAPRGADRFYNLVKQGYFDGIPWFRVMSGFMAQTGIHTDPSVSAAWRAARIQDDPVKRSNTRGMVTFAMGGPDTRSSHIFINANDNSNLDAAGFAPFGRVIRGQEVVDALYPIGDRTVDQYRANMEGAAYFKQFDKLDYIKSAKLE